MSQPLGKQLLTHRNPYPAPRQRAQNWRRQREVIFYGRVCWDMASPTCSSESSHGAISTLMLGKLPIKTHKHG